jgi:hypothetical protein
VKTGVRQQDASFGAPEQLDVQEIFQSRYLAANGALSHRVLLRRVGKALMARSRFK